MASKAEDGGWGMAVTAIRRWSRMGNGKEKSYFSQRQILAKERCSM